MTGTGQNRPGINQNPTKTVQESCMNPSELARKRAACCTDSFQCMIFRGFVYINQTFWQFSRIIFVFTNITGIKEAHNVIFDKIILLLFFHHPFFLRCHNESPHPDIQDLISENEKQVSLLTHGYWKALSDSRKILVDSWSATVSFLVGSDCLLVVSYWFW